MLFGHEPDEVICGVVIDIGDDVVTLSFGAVEVTRTVEGGADDQMAEETTEISHRGIDVSSFPVMTKPSSRTISRRESMFDLGHFSAPGEVEPLLVARDEKIRNGCVGSVVNRLVEDEPTALFRVGVDDVMREQVTHIVHDDDFLFFRFHSSGSLVQRRCYNSNPMQR